MLPPPIYDTLPSNGVSSSSSSPLSAPTTTAASPLSSYLSSSSPSSFRIKYVSKEELERTFQPAACDPTSSSILPRRRGDHLDRSGRPVLRSSIDCRTWTEKIIKIIEKDKLPASSGGDRLWRRLCLKLLRLTPNHPGLMTITDVFETDQEFYIVCEKLDGGELFEFLLVERAVPEELCKYIIRQLLEALHFLHAHDLVHRDLKPENVVFRHPRRVIPVEEVRAGGSQRSPRLRPLTSLECSQRMSLEELRHQFQLALIDFDTCKMVDIPSTDYPEVSNGRRRLVGTYGYLAPEVLRGYEYTAVSDMWSVGVILYILMTGVPPVPMEKMLNTRSALQVLQEIRRQGINFGLSPLPEFPLAQSLCRDLLDFDAVSRLSTASSALRHSWLSPNPLTPLLPPLAPAIFMPPSRDYWKRRLSPSHGAANVAKQPRAEELEEGKSTSTTT